MPEQAGASWGRLGASLNLHNAAIVFFVAFVFCSLFSVPKIKQEYFHNNRYPTILSVVYITTFLCIVCICLTTSQSEDSEFLALFVHASWPNLNRLPNAP